MSEITADALTSSGNSLKRARIARARSAAGIKGSEQSALVRQANARVKNLKESKIQKMVSQMIMRRAAELVRAAMIPAMGMTFVYKIVLPDKRALLIEDPHEIAHAIEIMGGIQEGARAQEERTYYFVSVKEPNFKAVEMLLDRGLGKVADKQKVEVKHSFSLTSLARERKHLPQAVQALPASLPIDVSAQIKEVEAEEET